ncbi:MAG TPA: zf-HC2 domain-containing protein [Myxococcales bacterium]|nr:zf-HC2 domain-containing protein [Myxococcales bacterium]
MTCIEANRLIGPWLDDELDVRSTVDVEGHVARCPACGREKEEILALRETAREKLPRFDPPPGLEERLLRSVRAEAVPRLRPARRWLREAALMAAAAAVAIVATSTVRPGADASSEIVDAHLRSLQAGHLTDVASSDQHTVKPWFQGRIDFGVPVRDFAAQGFPLIGGRLDMVDGRPVAALVYGRRQHLINVFVGPVADRDRPVRADSTRGYRVSSWAQGGLKYRLVTDVNAADADLLVALLRGP